jgi:hypothetical protein
MSTHAIATPGSTAGHHALTEVAEKLVKNLQVPQAEQGPHLDNWFNREAYDLNGQLSYFGSLDSAENFSQLLKRYFMRFSKVIFGGMLGRHNCKLTVIMKEGPTAAQWASVNPSLLGQAFPEILHNGDRRADIEIYQRFNRRDTPEAELLDYLGTLLHEMVHTVLDITPPDPTIWSDRSFDTGHGHSGHGLPWLKVAAAVEQFATSTLRLPVSLGLRTELWYELHDNGISIEEIDFSQMNMVKIDFISYVLRLSGVPAHEWNWVDPKLPPPPTQSSLPIQQPPLPIQPPLPPTQNNDLEEDLSGDEMGETDEQEYSGEDASEYEDMAVDSTDGDDVDESGDEGILDH